MIVPHDADVDVLRSSCHVLNGESDTIFVTGIKKKLCWPKFYSLIENTGGKIVASCFKNGKAWLRMKSISDARAVVNAGTIGLHDQSSIWMKEIVRLQDRPIMIRFELGTANRDRRLESRPVRAVQYCLHDPKEKADDATLAKYRPKYTYNNDSISISTPFEEVVLPVCTGRYILEYHRLVTKMNEFTVSFNSEAFENSLGLTTKNESKELSEVMAMISAFKRVIDSSLASGVNCDGR